MCREEDRQVLQKVYVQQIRKKNYLMSEGRRIYREGGRETERERGSLKRAFATVTARNNHCRESDKDRAIKLIEYYCIDLLSETIAFVRYLLLGKIIKLPAVSVFVIFPLYVLYKLFRPPSHFVMRNNIFQVFPMNFKKIFFPFTRNYN